MKILGALLFSVFLSLSFDSKADGTILPFVAYWSVGDTYDFKITKINRKWHDGRMNENDSTVSIHQFKVLDSTETGYRISWTMKESLGHPLFPRSLMGKSKLFAVHDIIYNTDELGTYIGIENLDSIVALSRAFFHALMAEGQASKNLDRTSFEKTMDPIIQMYTSKEGIELKLFSELHLMHFPFGLEYSVTKPIHYDDELPNFLGGKPLRAKGKIHFENVDFDKKFCSMRQELQVNKTDATNMIKEVLGLMNLDSKELMKALKSSKMDFRESNRFDYFYYPGIPTMIEYKRTGDVKIGNVQYQNLEVIRIELLD
jgi:hypothetical protein